MSPSPDFSRAHAIAGRVSEFIREEIVPCEAEVREHGHGPDQALLTTLRERARCAGVLTPHIPANGEHLSHRGPIQMVTGIA